jgi:hypothetical protein
MALADTYQAIGKVTMLLHEHLVHKTDLPVTVGRPEPGSNGGGQGGPRLNLFLYEALFDPSLKNVPLDEGQKPPLWLVLKYLITAYDELGHSDTILAHEQLGKGLRALQELSFLSLSAIALPADILPALKDNPEVLKITFDEASSELLSKLMQGSDEKYRFSMAFQVRPVMIAPAAPPDYSLLVGVDYTATPPAVIGEEGIHLEVLPSMGPLIDEIMPSRFEVKDTITVKGANLDLSGLSLRLGQASLAVTAQRPDRLQAKVNGGITGGTILSAGSQVLAVVQSLSGGRSRSSNLLVGGLLPTLKTAAPSGLLLAATPPPRVYGDIIMTGTLLGRQEDDLFVALYQEGQAVKVFDAPFTFSPGQTGLTLHIPDTLAVPPGSYRLILRINGQQARQSPTVGLVV